MADSIESTQTSMTRDSGITACPLACNICGLSFMMVMLELATRRRRSCDVIPSVLSPTTMKDYPCRFGEGCRKKDSGCQYVHPSDPNYQQSVQQKESQDSRHGGPSPGHRRFANATASNTTTLPDGPRRWGRNAPNSGGVHNSSASEDNASSAWNFSGQSTTNRRSSNAAVTTDTTAGFGNSGWGSTDNNASTPNGTGWGTGGADSTWANDDATVGWSASNSVSLKDDGGWGTGNSGSQKDDGGWGAPKPGGQKDDGGWGAPKPGGSTDAGGWGAGGQKGDGGWGTAKTGGQKGGRGWGSSNANTKSHSKDDSNNKGWDQSTTSSFESWGSMEEKSNDAQKDKGEGLMSNDIPMRDPSPTRKRDEPQPKPAHPIPQSPSKESPVQMPLSPKYVSLPSAVSKKPSSDLKTLALEVARPTEVPTKIKGTEGRGALYQSTIKHTKNAIIAYIEHQEAQDDLNRWKDTQMSTIYGHATQKTRKILDSERATFHRRLQDGEDTFKKEINALVDLPEWSTTNKKRKANALTKEGISKYTQELQEWFKDLEIHKRLLMEGEPEEGEIAEEKEEGEVNDSDDEDIGQRISELLRSGNWTWKKLTEVIEAMQSRYDAIQTSIYFDIFTSIGDDSKAGLRLASANLESIGQEETQDAELSSVSEKIATTGKFLERQSEGLARLLNEAAELEKEIEAVRFQTTQASSVCQLADRLFGDFEQWKEDDNAQLAAITEQVKFLRLHQPSTPSTSGNQSASVVTAAAPPHPATSSRSAPESISPSDLIDPIRRLVIGAIHQELKLCFDNLRFRCMENQQRLEADMEKEAKNIMFKADIVKSRLPSIRPVPGQSNIPLVAHSYAPP